MFTLVLAFTGGCITDDGADDGAGDLSGLGPGGVTRGQGLVSVRFRKTAEENWLRGNEEFEDGEYAAAQQYFKYIRLKFPYSRFAALSEVRIADCQYEREKPLEAIDTYKTFVRMHPSHKQVPYALYRIGTVYYDEIPSDFFPLPPAHEKDQSAVRDAERALSEYVQRFPKHENASAARTKLADVRKRLMAHEEYVADFYGNLDRDRARVGRLEIIRRDFADVGLTDELLSEIAEIWARLGEIEKAQSAFSQLEKEFPKSDEVEDTRARIAEAKRKAVERETGEETDDDDDS